MQWLFTMLMALEICLPHPAKIQKLRRLQQDAQALPMEARALPEEAALAVEARAQETDIECDVWCEHGPSAWPEHLSGADGYGYDECYGYDEF